MIKLLFNVSPDTRIDYKENVFLSFIKISVFILIALLLSQRDMYIAPDDYSYMSYFNQLHTINSNNYFLYLIEEPVWHFWIYVTTLIFNPENALRFTIFFITILFLFSASKVNNKLFLLVAIVFIFHEHFATQMYFNQIRQGFALSLFLFFATYLKRPVIGSAIAILIHTSFIFPFLVIVLITKVKSIRGIVLFSIIGLLLLYISTILLDNLDLGRRTTSYEFEGKFAFSFYIYSIMLYTPILLLIAFFRNKEKFHFWFKLTLSAFFIFLGFTLFYSAAGRLLYYLSAFMLLMIMENYKSLGGKLALSYYFLFFVMQTLYFEPVVFERWSLILYRQWL